LNNFNEHSSDWISTLDTVFGKISKSNGSFETFTRNKQRTFIWKQESAQADGTEALLLVVPAITWRNGTRNCLGLAHICGSYMYVELNYCGLSIAIALAKAFSSTKK